MHIGQIPALTEKPNRSSPPPPPPTPSGLGPLSFFSGVSAGDEKGRGPTLFLFS